MPSLEDSLTINEAPRDVPGQPCEYVLHIIIKQQSQVAALAAAISVQKKYLHCHYTATKVP